MAKKLEVRLFSEQQHNAQILTGFYLLGQGKDYDVRICDFIGRQDGNNSPKSSIVEVIADDGTKIAYDTLDGYQSPEAMEFFLKECDFYFKRSFSSEKNGQMFPQYADKIYPLGFNYLVTYRGCPIKQSFSRRIAKTLCGRKTFEYFTPDKFECEPEFTAEPKIIFCTRLWKSMEINSMRIELIKTLKSRYGDRFFGGLSDGEHERRLAPELILPQKYTVRENYLRKMQQSDICIASTGLHGSIGWKTGEYVAAAKGIVSEKLIYEVTGGFEEGKNYLSFDSVENCLRAVDELVQNPDRLYEMKKANAAYYAGYLQPEQMIKNTLKVVYGE